MTRDAFRLRWCPDHTLTHDGADRDGEALFLADLDSLLAATRAEALATCVEVCKAKEAESLAEYEVSKRQGHWRLADFAMERSGAAAAVRARIRALVKP